MTQPDIQVVPFLVDDANLLPPSPQEADGEGAPAAVLLKHNLQHYTLTITPQPHPPKGRERHLKVTTITQG